VSIYILTHLLLFLLESCDCMHAINRLLYTCHQAFIVYIPSSVYCIHAINRLLFTCHQVFIVYMPSGVDFGAVFHTHILLYSESSLWGWYCSSRQITSFRVLVPCCAVRNDWY